MTRQEQIEELRQMSLPELWDEFIATKQALAEAEREKERLVGQTDHLAARCMTLEKANEKLIADRKKRDSYDPNAPTL